MKRTQLPASITRFPQSPGIYLMKDASGRHLYIGKAVNLRSRVRSYFHDTGDGRFQIPHLMDKVSSIEWIATNNETEALILEANLIRTHQPPYNLDLKDDKHYPYLKVTLQEPFPRLLVVRRVINDGAQYFGPFTDVGTMRKLMDFAHVIFRIRDCKRRLPLKKPVRPCINYSIGRCHGACAGYISPEEYARQVAMLIQFFKGRRNDITAILDKRMKEASARLDYESAASLRDQINLIRKASHMQRVDLKTPQTDFDVFGTAESSRHTCLGILSFRQGLLFSKRHFLFKKQVWHTSSHEHESVIIRFYQHALDNPPPTVILPPEMGVNKELLSSWFARQYAQPVRVSIAHRGSKAQLISLAKKNAKLYLDQKVPDDAGVTLQLLGELLHLPRFPEHIEAFDISNLGDKYPVAGMVHFSYGKPDKSRYRRFKIKTVAGQNDFAMLMEAVTRRLTRLHAERKPFPDLLLIDGGKGQLSSAAKPLTDFENPPMIIALAKKEETLYSPYVKDPIRLAQNHPVRRLAERIRDEVHRWVLSYHKQVRGKQFRASTLEAIPGIGKKRARALLRHFGSAKRLRQASPEQIAAVEGFSEKIAKHLLNHLKK